MFLPGHMLQCDSLTTNTNSSLASQLILVDTKRKAMQCKHWLLSLYSTHYNNIIMIIIQINTISLIQKIYTICPGGDHASILPMHITFFDIDKVGLRRKPGSSVEVSSRWWFLISGTERNSAATIATNHPPSIQNELSTFELWPADLCDWFFVVIG